MIVNWKSCETPPVAESIVLVRDYKNDSLKFNYCVCFYDGIYYTSLETGLKYYPTHWDYISDMKSLANEFISLVFPFSFKNDKVIHA